jgi:hypothetical protein
VVYIQNTCTLSESAHAILPAEPRFRD